MDINPYHDYIDPRMANVLFFLFEAMGIGAVAYAVWTAFGTLGAISAQSRIIAPDTGAYYLLLMFIFPWLHLTTWLARTHRISAPRLNGLTVVLFLSIGLFAWSGGHYVRTCLHNAGYSACEDVLHHRVVPGDFRMYTRDPTDCLSKRADATHNS